MFRSIVCSFAVVTSTAIVHPQSLLRDIRPGAPDVSESSDPRGFVVLGGHAYFTAIDRNGRELWRTDGTAAGTSLVVDLRPGRFSSLLETTPLVKVGNRLMFAAFTRAGYRLFVSDGTAAGTQPIGPTGLSFLADENAFVLAGNVLYFVANDFTHGLELWRSDGTDAGTRMVADVNPGSDHGFRVVNRTVQMAPFGNGVLFAGDDGSSGIEPWFSDGTAAGTRLVHDVWAGVGDGDPRVFHVLGNRVLFAASTQANTFNWWTTDGTSAGTSKLNNLEVRAYDRSSIVDLGGFVLFSGFTFQHGHELWRTDGTQPGTQFVADLYPGNYWSNPSDFVELGGVAYFAARDTTNERRLWRSDGTAAGTALVAPGSLRGYVTELTPIGGRLFLSARSSSAGFEPWVSDGTANGTFLLRDVNPGIFHSGASGFTAVGARVLFRADDGTHGIEPWTTDGTANGTVRLKDLRAAAPESVPVDWVRAGESLYFTTGDRAELWATDGTSARTRRMAVGTPIGHVEAEGDALLYSIETNLWRVESATSSPRLFHRFSSYVSDFERAPGTVYASIGFGLWRLDDGAATETLVRTFQNGFYPAPPRSFEQADGALFFLASEGQFGASGLWRSDGTNAGTVLVHAAAVGVFSAGTPIADMIVAHDRLWFAHARDGVHNELWVADRTSTRMVASIGDAVPGRLPELTAFNGGVAFAGHDLASGLEPWWSDGTTTGRIADLRPGPDDSAPTSLVVAGGTLFFAADDGVAGRELWRSDGTAGGTVRVADLRPGPLGSYPAAAMPAGSGERIVFAADDADHGRETWVSDGTAAGTFRVTDLVPGPASSDPDGHVRVGARLVFAADDDRVGREPFVLPLAATGAWLAAGYGEGCPGAAGVPELGGNGPARAGAAGFAATLARARPLASAGLLAAALPARLALPGGCTLLLSAPFPAGNATTDAAGNASFALPIPNDPALLGAQLRLQAIVADPGGALGGALALTGGLHVLIGR